MTFTALFGNVVDSESRIGDRSVAIPACTTPSRRLTAELPDRRTQGVAHAGLVDDPELRELMHSGFWRSVCVSRA